MKFWELRKESSQGSKQTTQWKLLLIQRQKVWARNFAEQETCLSSAAKESSAVSKEYFLAVLQYKRFITRKGYMDEFEK